MAKKDSGSIKACVLSCFGDQPEVKKKRKGHAKSPYHDFLRNCMKEEKRQPGEAGARQVLKRCGEKWTKLKAEEEMAKADQARQAALAADRPAPQKRSRKKAGTKVEAPAPSQ